jgi:hypothetical protein
MKKILNYLINRLFSKKNNIILKIDKKHGYKEYCYMTGYLDTTVTTCPPPYKEYYFFENDFFKKESLFYSERFEDFIKKKEVYESEGLFIAKDCLLTLSESKIGSIILEINYIISLELTDKGIDFVLNKTKIKVNTKCLNSEATLLNIKNKLKEIELLKKELIKIADKIQKKEINHKKIIEKLRGVVILEGIETENK